MRNPNGYGSVTKLSGNRRRSYWVRKTIGWKENGQPKYETIGYTTTREEGLMLLADYNMNPWNIDAVNITLQELFDKLLQKKSMQKSETKYSKSKSIYNVHMKHLGTMKYREIKAYHMQECIDKCNRGYSTQSAIKTLWGHLDNLALELDISNKKYSTLIHAVDEQPETTRDRFSNEEIIKIWEAYHDYKNGHIIKKVHQEILDTVLIFLYTGYRISELTSLKTEQIDLNQKLITHGIKTAAGKGRIIPIHSKILPLVEERYNEKSEYFLTFKGRRYSTSTYRAHWHSIMNYLGIDKTVHETRHTLESILDSERANKKCIDLLMGHASKDVGNRVYNHKTIAQLRETIELMNI